MTRHEYNKLSAGSKVIADQATRREVWEGAACEDLHDTAAASEHYDPAALAARFDHWADVGATYFDGPPPLSGLVACLRGLMPERPAPGTACPLVALLATYDEIDLISGRLFEDDAHEGHVVALMNTDRFALDRLTARAFLAKRANADEGAEETVTRVLVEACEGLPRLSSPGR